MLISEVHEFFSKETPEHRAETERRSIPVWEEEWIYRRIHRCGFPVTGIVEIGTFRGRTTIWLAAVAHQFGVGVTTVDIDPVAADSAYKMAEEAGLKNVTAITADSRDAVKMLRGNVWVIDGEHSYRNTIIEAMAAISEIRRSDLGCGLIIFDDAGHVHEDGMADGGVPRAVSELGASLITETYNRFAVLEVKR